MKNELRDPKFQERWKAVREPGSEFTQRQFQKFRKKHPREKILNCAIPLAIAKSLTDFQFPEGWDGNKSLIGSCGPVVRPKGLEEWEYTPKIKAVRQGTHFKRLPTSRAYLDDFPWFQSPSQALGLGINARHLRYHHDLWQDLKPKTLRGVQTTIVYVTPQLGFSLTPHIQLDGVFNYFAALSRSAGPVQLFPAEFLYPDANLQPKWRQGPAPIFADILPRTGGINLPAFDGTPNRWGTFTRLEGPDYFYGYPFHGVEDYLKDITLHNYMRGPMLLPDGKVVEARRSESFVYATLDEKLKQDLKMDREAFQEAHCLVRGVVTHDGLPFQLPVQMQTAVFAIILTGWTMELDQAGDLSSYTLKTRHAAIRGYHFHQRIEPYYSNFQRLVEKLGRTKGFAVYPLTTHLTDSWLEGNLMLSNQRSKSEQELGIQFMRSYYHQQLDWSMGVFNLWNHVDFRREADLEKKLAYNGLAFHQMRPQLRFDTHLFCRPSRRASFWWSFHPDWLEFDQKCRARRLPEPVER